MSEWHGCGLRWHDLRRRDTRQRDPAPPPPDAPPGGIGAVVAHAGLVTVGHVIHPAGDELECDEAVDASVGAIVAIGDELDLGAVGVVAQPRLGDGRACGVASHAQQGVAIIAGDRRADVDAEAGVGPGEHAGGGAVTTRGGAACGARKRGSTQRAHERRRGAASRDRGRLGIHTRRAASRSVPDLDKNLAGPITPAAWCCASVIRSQSASRISESCWRRTGILFRTTSQTRR